MLYLYRRRGERILIGDDITLQVVDFDGGKVKLGVEAPRAISVHRSEVLDRIRRGEKPRGQTSATQP